MKDKFVTRKQAHQGGPVDLMKTVHLTAMSNGPGMSVFPPRQSARAFLADPARRTFAG
jgi:hypothetical protein